VLDIIFLYVVSGSAFPSFAFINSIFTSSPSSFSSSSFSSSSSSSSSCSCSSYTRFRFCSIDKVEQRQPPVTIGLFERLLRLSDGRAQKVRSRSRRRCG
jgi:hypothetical protein